MDTTCPKCGTTYEVDKEDFGTTVECEICHARFQVPKPKSTKTKIRVPHNYHTRIQTVEVKSGHGCLSALLGVFLVFAIIVLGYIVLVLGGCTAGCYSVAKHMMEEDEREIKKVMDFEDAQQSPKLKEDKKPTNISDWNVSKTKDDITDMVTYSLERDGLRIMDGLTEYNPTFIIKVQKNQDINGADCLLWIAPEAIKRNGVQADVRINTNPSERILLMPGQNRSAVFFPTSFIQKLYGADTLVVRLDTSLGKTRTYKFLLGQPTPESIKTRIAQGTQRRN